MKGQTIDLWVVPGAQVRIEGYTGVGTTTKNQFLRTIDDDYHIDCGGLMPVSSKCDYLKGPQEDPLKVGAGCYTRQTSCVSGWDCNALRSTDARNKCRETREKLGSGSWKAACYNGCVVDMMNWYCPTDRYPCKNPETDEWDTWPEK